MRGIWPRVWTIENTHTYLLVDTYILLHVASTIYLHSKNCYNHFYTHHRFTIIGLPFMGPQRQILTNGSFVFVLTHPDLVRKLFTKFH